MKTISKNILSALFAGLVLFLAACGNGALADQQLSPERVLDGGLFIDVHQAYQFWEEGTYLLDVRTPEEWNQAHIPGAFLIPLDELQARIKELPIDQDIVIYCRTGNRSAQALGLLQNADYSTAYSMVGGINDWIKVGYPVE